MKIIIVGIGKVGYAIAEQMTGENHDLVVIDRNSAVLDHVDSMLDVMCVEGNGASASVLLEAGVREAGPSHRRFGKRRGQPHLLPVAEKARREAHGRPRTQPRVFPRCTDPAPRDRA